MEEHIEYKESPWGSIPSHWGISSIKEETEVVTDYVANGSFASLAENVKYKSKKDYAVLIRLVDYNNQFKGEFVYIDKNAYEFLSKSKLYGGEIIISNVGANVGTVFKCPHLEYKMSLAPNSIMVKFKGNNDFYYYWLKSHYGQHMLQSIVTGSAQPKFNKTNFRDLNIPVPPYKEQERIASILKSLDDKIENNRRINENLEQQALALFKSWFVDFEPFKNGEFVESELGMIPKGWRVGDIYEYIKVIYGAPYKSSLFNENKKGLPLIRIRDLKTNSPQFYTPEILPMTEYIEAGDVVAGMDAEFIPYVWQGEKGVLNQRCCKFKGCNDAISNYYILFLVKPQLEYVQSYKSGTTVSHLGKSDIDRFKFVTPPLDIIENFSKIVEPMKEEVVNRAKESRRLAELRDTLLPKLMSGEIKVEDIKI